MKQAKRMAPAILGCVTLLWGWPATGRADDFTLGDVLGDARLYFTAPVRWDGADWLFFGGSLASIAVAHDFDSRVRNHFAPAGAAGVTGADTNSSRDALPAASLVVGTWLAAEFTDDSFARTEAYTMLESAGFSSITAEVFKYAAGRERPNETTDPNAWREGGSSFPSLHATAAFAIGTVFAESGSDDYRWFRRVLGYGMAKRDGLSAGAGQQPIGCPTPSPGLRWESRPHGLPLIAVWRGHTTGICRWFPPRTAGCN